MFVPSAEGVIARTKQDISARKTIITIFFTSAGLLVLNFLLKETKFNQDYFIDAIFPELYSERIGIARRKGESSLAVHMDNSMYHGDAKIIEKLGKEHIARAFHPLYSRDLSPCDFWLFGMLKEKIKDRVFRSEQHILAAITRTRNELAFEDIQRVFLNWMERLI
jgi:transposase